MNNVERTAGRFIAAPEILTQRLILRAHRRDDFDAVAEMWANEEVVRFISGRPYSRSESWSRLIRFGGHWQIMGFGSWAVEDRATGSYLGSLGFSEYMREMTPSVEGIPEAGWALAPSAQGQGLAFEAMVAVLDWADEHLSSDKTVALFAPDNTRSIRLAEKCGYVRSGTTTLAEELTLVMERRRRG